MSHTILVSEPSSGRAIGDVIDSLYLYLHEYNSTFSSWLSLGEVLEEEASDVRLECERKKLERVQELYNNDIDWK